MEEITKVRLEEELHVLAEMGDVEEAVVKLEEEEEEEEESLISTNMNISILYIFVLP